MDIIPRHLGLKPVFIGGTTAKFLLDIHGIIEAPYKIKPSKAIKFTGGKITFDKN